MACPSAVVPKGWWPDGLSHQEAPQADGEEEAPQAAEEDADPAQEQEVAGSAGATVLAGAPGACPRTPLTGAEGSLPLRPRRDSGFTPGNRWLAGLIQVTRRSRRLGWPTMV